MAGEERLRELEEKYEGFSVYDNAGEKIGKVDDLFVDETDREEYIGVKMGLFGLSGTTLIPMEMARVNDRERAIEVSETKERVKDAPHYRDDDEVDVSFEERIREHFGLENVQTSGERSSYGRYSDGASGAAAGAASTRDDDTLIGDRDDDRHSGGAMGGAENRDRIESDRMDQDRMDQDRMGQESYRNREGMGSESSMGAAGAGGTSASGGMPDLETGERDRDDTDRGDLGGDREEVGGMTRGHREGGDRGDRGDLGSSGQGAERSGLGDEGAQGGAAGQGYREGYREGVREGIKEGLREAGDLSPGGRDEAGRGSTQDEGYRESGGRDEFGDRGDRGSSGVGEEGMTGDREERSSSDDRSRERTGEEESGATRVWRRITR